MSFMVVVPLVDGKKDAWAEAAKGRSGSQELVEIMKSLGCTKIHGWAATTPSGESIAIVVHEGDELTAEKFMGAVMANPNAAAMMKENEEFHGPMDMSAGPPPAAEKCWEISIP